MHVNVKQVKQIQIGEDQFYERKGGRKSGDLFSVKDSLQFVNVWYC